MKYSCLYNYMDWYGMDNCYTCNIKDQMIHESNNQFYDGTHDCGKSRFNVNAIWYENCKVTKVPQKLMKFFPNLQILCIGNSNLKSLEKGDLAEYKNLKVFDFDHNRIQFLPGDLFENFINLKKVSFFNNYLVLIEPSIFEGCNALEHVDFRNNSNYDSHYSGCTLHPVSLEQIQLDLKLKFSARFNHVKELENLNQQLCKNSQKLKNDLENERTVVFELAKNSQKHLLNDLKGFFQDETFKDFKIIIDDREFPVHKFLLAARSPTLAEMLRKNPDAENLKLVDISVGIFELILNFLYTDELPSKSGTNFLQLFAAAGRLNIDELKNFAADKLVSKIDEMNALEILNLSLKYDCEELKLKAFAKLMKIYPNIAWMKNSKKKEELINIIKSREEMMKKFDDKFMKLLIYNNNF